MKKVCFVAAAAALAAAACASGPLYEYAGQWGKYGTANGRFDTPRAVAVASSGNVYVADSHNHRVQCFTADRFVSLRVGRVRL